MSDIERFPEKPPEPYPEVYVFANRLAKMTLFPEDIITVCDALREGILRNPLPHHNDIASELAILSDWLTAYDGF